VPEISALPHSVDKPLIQSVNGDKVISRFKIRRNVYFVVIILKMIGRRRTLRHEFSVDIKLIIVIGGYVNLRIFKRACHQKLFSEKNMLIPMLAAIQR
jgi:hypothetical protein